MSAAIAAEPIGASTNRRVKCTPSVRASNVSGSRIVTASVRAKKTSAKPMPLTAPNTLDPKKIGYWFFLLIFAGPILGALGAFLGYRRMPEFQQD